MTAPGPGSIPRLAARRVASAIEDTPALMVTGPRQSGKTTLVRAFAGRDRDEVDAVVESREGAVVGIEVETAATVGAADFKGVRKPADACVKELGLGVVLYDGEQGVPFGERIFAAPDSCLWA